MAIDAEVKDRLLAFQRNEITEHHIYRRLARAIQSPENRQVLERIAAALSMTASEYLSTKSEETVKSPARAALYTGVAYIEMSGLSMGAAGLSFLIGYLVRTFLGVEA